MASSRDRPAATAAGNYYLPGRPPIYLEPSITHQPDLHSLKCMLDILFLIVQHIRRRPLHTEPMPNQTYFTDDRAYNILYQYRRDTMLLDRLVDSLATARRLLQFVPGQPSLPGQYRIDPSARIPPETSATLQASPPNPILPSTPSDHSSSPRPGTPPEDALRFLHHWTGPAAFINPPPERNQSHHNTHNNHNHARDRSRSRDTHTG